MAERRMFAKTIIDSDAFIDMPLTAQAFYFHLSMRADDDGFVNNPKKIQRMIGCSDDDMRLLIVKRFIIPFESGVCVIKHWKIHNYIQSDRYKETVYTEEKRQLITKENKSYSLPETACIQNGYSMDTQSSLVKSSQELAQKREDPLSSGDDERAAVPSRRASTDKKREFAEFVTMTQDEYDSLCERVGESGAKRCIEILDNYKGAKGKQYKSDYRAILSWVLSKYEEEPKPEPAPVEYAYPQPEDNLPIDIAEGDTLADILRKMDAQPVHIVGGTP